MDTSKVRFAKHYYQICSIWFYFASFPGKKFLIASWNFYHFFWKQIFHLKEQLTYVFEKFAFVLRTKPDYNKEPPIDCSKANSCFIICSDCSPKNIFCTNLICRIKKVVTETFSTWFDLINHTDFFPHSSKIRIMVLAYLISPIYPIVVKNYVKILIRNI